MTRDEVPLGEFLRASGWEPELRRFGSFVRRSSARDVLRRPRNLLNVLLSTLDFPRYAEVPFLLSAFPEGSGGAVLDISSPKWPAAYLARRHGGLRIVASDLSGYFVPWLLRIARRQSTEDRLLPHVCDARKLPFPDSHFDFVYSLSVFEHIEPEPGGDREASREAFRVLKPGGLFLVTVPMAPAYRTREMPWDGSFERRYTPDSFGKAAIDGVGWRVDFERSFIMFEEPCPLCEDKVGGWIDYAMVGSAWRRYRCRANFRRRAMEKLFLLPLTEKTFGDGILNRPGLIPSHLLMRLIKPA